MKQFKYLLIYLVITGITACGGDGGGDPAPTPEPLTNAEKIAKTWKVDSAFLNGQNDTATGNYGSFRITFRANAQGNASTYSVTPGSAPSKPNWNSPDTGNWGFSSGTSRIDFNGSTTVNVVGTPNEERLVLEWQLPIEEDKTESTYRFELIPN